MVGRGPILRAIRAYGRVASVYQTLTPPFSYWTGAGCAVAYVVAKASPLGPTVWLSAGEPIGPLDAVAPAARAFEAAARASGAHALWFGVESKERLGGVGTALVIGAQPVWRAGDWDDRLARKASLRAQVNRARNKGVAVREVTPDEATASPALRQILADWVASRGMPPLAFLANPYVLDDLTDRRVFIASREGRSIAYLVLAPIPARGAWHVEWIIQPPGAPNGTPSLLIDAVCRAVDPTSEVTLGLVPLTAKAPLSTQEPPLPVRTLLAWTRAHARRFYNFEGLERFKAKFLPETWETVYLVTTRRYVSPFTFYAIADAFAGRRSPIRLVGRALADAVASETRTALRALSLR